MWSLESLGFKSGWLFILENGLDHRRGQINGHHDAREVGQEIKPIPRASDGQKSLHQLVHSAAGYRDHTHTLQELAGKVYSITKLDLDYQLTWPAEQEDDSKTDNVEENKWNI